MDLSENIYVRKAGPANSSSDRLDTKAEDAF